MLEQNKGRAAPVSIPVCCHYQLAADRGVDHLSFAALCPGVQGGDVSNPTMLDGDASGLGALQEDARTLWWGISGKSRDVHTRDPAAAGRHVLVESQIWV